MLALSRAASVRQISSPVLSLSRLSLQTTATRGRGASMGWGEVPDRWEDYSNIGRVVEGTRFIPFKVPLNEFLLMKIGPGVEIWGLKQLLETVPQLGLVVDLTNTSRYYKAKQLEGMGVRYCKIFTKGHEVPDKGVVDKFYKAVEGMEDGKMIGVHCTHGLNRTGYLICRYLVEKTGVEPDVAIQAFDVARGHKLERENYLEHLRNRAWERESGNSRGGSRGNTERNNWGKDGGGRRFHTDIRQSDYYSGQHHGYDQNSDYYQDYHLYDDYYSDYFQDYHPGYCYPFPVQQYTPTHNGDYQGYGGGGGGHGNHHDSGKGYNHSWGKGSPYIGSHVGGQHLQLENTMDKVKKDELSLTESSRDKSFVKSEQTNHSEEKLKRNSGIDKENRNSEGNEEGSNSSKGEVKPNLVTRMPSGDTISVCSTRDLSLEKREMVSNKSSTKRSRRKSGDVSEDQGEKICNESRKSRNQRKAKKKKKKKWIQTE